MKSRDLTQAEIEALRPDEYSLYLAFGSTLDPYKDLTDEEYADYIQSHREFDL